GGITFTSDASKYDQLINSQVSSASFNGVVQGYAKAGSKAAFINTSQVPQALRRGGIAHEAFHARFPGLGRSETLARFIGGFQPHKEWQFINRIDKGLSEALSYNRALIGGDPNYGSFFNRNNSIFKANVGDIVRDLGSAAFGRKT